MNTEEQQYQADMREWGKIKKNIPEVKIYEQPQKKPLERRLFHSAAILSCRSFPAFCLFIYSSAIKVNFHLYVYMCVYVESKRLKNNGKECSKCPFSALQCIVLSCAKETLIS